MSNGSRWRLPLGFRLAVLPLVGALPLFVILWDHASQHMAELRRNAERSVEQAALAAAGAQDEAIDQVGAFLATIGQLAPVERFDPLACDATLANAIRGQPLVQTLVVLDAGGFMRCHSEGFRLAGSQLDRPDIRAALAQAGPFLRQPSTSQRTGKPTASLVLAVREPDEQGAPRLIVSATFDPARVPALAAGIDDDAFGPNDGRTVFAIDQLGRLLDRTPDNAPALTPASIDSMLTAPSGVRLARDAAGRALARRRGRERPLDACGAGQHRRADRARQPPRVHASLAAAFAAASVGDTSVTLLMIDVDHFKLFNDTQGHPAGDEALRG